MLYYKGQHHDIVLSSANTAIKVTILPLTYPGWNWKILVLGGISLDLTMTPVIQDKLIVYLPFKVCIIKLSTWSSLLNSTLPWTSAKNRVSDVQLTLKCFPQCSIFSKYKRAGNWVNYVGMFWNYKSSWVIYITNVLRIWQLKCQKVTELGRRNSQSLLNRISRCLLDSNLTCVTAVS